jgi:NADPH-dependent 2,4-dienoyl-CoA reductase/sulfur reductase-like enzyme
MRDMRWVRRQSSHFEDVATTCVFCSCCVLFDNSKAFYFRFLYAEQDVVVIGGGDTAMEDALVLARTSRSVVVIHRRDKFRASKVRCLC